jgi:hypothetical protein
MLGVGVGEPTAASGSHPALGCSDVSSGGVGPGPGYEHGDLPEGVDPRGARFAGGVMAVTLLAGFVFGMTWVIPLWLAFRLATAVLPPKLDPATVLYEVLVAPRLRPPAMWEDPTPLRFAALVEAGVLALGSLVAWVGIDVLAWVAALGAAASGALLAVADHCLGCELHERFEHRGR